MLLTGKWKNSCGCDRQWSATLALNGVPEGAVPAEGGDHLARNDTGILSLTISSPETGTFPPHHQLDW